MNPVLLSVPAIANESSWYTTAGTDFTAIFRTAVGWFTDSTVPALGICLFAGLAIVAMRVFKRAKKAVR